MTKEEILALPAGRELNCLICEYVFGMVWCKEPLDENGRAINAGYPYLTDKTDVEKNKRTIVEKHHSYLEWMDHEPNYSTDIASAWKVLEKFEFISVSKGQIVNSVREQFDGNGWFSKSYQCTIHAKTDIKVHGKTAPEAICKAALIAML